MGRLMDLTRIKYSKSGKLPSWRSYFYNLGGTLASNEFNNSLIFIFAPYSKGILPLLTIGYYQIKIKREFEKKIEEYSNYILEKVRSNGGELSATYIWNNKRYEGTLKNTSEGLKIYCGDINFGCYGRNVLKVHEGHQDNVQFQNFDKKVKSFVESFYNIEQMEYLDSVNPIRLELWGMKRKLTAEFEEQIQLHKDKSSGRFVDLLGITGSQGGNHIKKYIVSETRVREVRQDVVNDLTLFDSARAYQKGANMTESKLKIVLVDSFDAQKEEAKRQFVTDRMVSLSDIKFQILQEYKLPSGVELSGFKF